MEKAPKKTLSNIADTRDKPWLVYLKCKTFDLFAMKGMDDYEQT